MDNTKVPRPLIFRERRSLEEFFDNSPLNETLIDNMSNVYYMQKQFKERALKCMNTAYYICTLMLREKHPEWSFGTYGDLAFCENKDNKVHQAVTLSLVSIYINGLCEDQRQKLQKLKKQLDDFMNSILHFIQYGDPFLNDCLYADILKIIKGSLTYYSIDENEFAFRVIDKEAVRDVMAVKSFNWVIFVDYFRESRVRELVDYYGSSEDEKHNVIDILRQAANGFYTMGYNDKPEQVNKMLDTIENEILYRYNSEAKNERLGEELKKIKVQGNGDKDLLEALNEEKEKNARLEEQIAGLLQPVEELTAEQKVRMEFAVRLLQAAGLSDDKLRRPYGVKVATVMSLLLDIRNNNKRGSSAQTCQTFLSDRRYYPERNKDLLIKLNTLCVELGLNLNLDL